MELLRHVVVLLHIVGFAVTFGAWTAEAAARRFRTTRLMDYGLLLSLITGLALAAPWPAGIDLNYPKIGIYPDRAPRCDSHHRHPGRYSVPGISAGKGASP